MAHPQSAGAASAAPVLEPTTQKFIDALAAGSADLHLEPGAARDVLAGAQAQPVAKLPAAIEDTTFPVGPTGSVRIRIVRPKAERRAAGRHALPRRRLDPRRQGHPRPPDPRDRRRARRRGGLRRLRSLARGAISGRHRTGLRGHEVYRRARPASWTSIATRLAIAGDSVGGNMAAAVTLMAKERRGPRIALQVLFYPVTDADFDTGSYQQLRRRAVADQAGDGVVLGRLSARRRGAPADHRVAAARLARAARGPARRARHRRRERRAARRGRGVRAQARSRPACGSRPSATTARSTTS